MTKEYWEQVARNTESVTAANYDHLSGILGLSYTNLPPHLKSCFLYLGVFKEDCQIQIKELEMLWMAEGFLKATGSKDMEGVAEEYLEELVARSLVLVQKKRKTDGKIKTCSLHDVVRELCIRKANEERFSQYITRSSLSMDTNMRRISFDWSSLTGGLAYEKYVRNLRYDERTEWVFDDVQEENSSRALSAIGRWQLRLIRVLGEVFVSKSSQLRILYKLTNLRYLHIFLSYGSATVPPLTVDESISILQNLETLIFSGSWRVGDDQYKLVLPSGIWEIPRLRHLVLITQSSLTCPTVSQMSCSGLQTLQTLTWVTNFNMSRNMTEKLGNLKKLNLYYENIGSKDQTKFGFNNIVHLHHLEELTVLCGTPILLAPYFCSMQLTDSPFPHMLRRLTLDRTPFPVEKMSVIGS